MKNKTEQFYSTMKYPLPSKEVINFFQSAEWVTEDSLQYHPELCDLFSREKTDDRMSEYIAFCDEYWSLRTKIPFVEQVYLANSITFNALHEWSDIDVLIVVRPWRVWLVRMYTWLLFFIKWILRTGPRIAKKICTSFFVDSKHLNFYTLLLQPLDIYFIFWLAHLVPRYSLQIKESDVVWKNNKRIKGYMPHHPLKQVIRLQNELCYGTTKTRDFVEIVLWSWLGDICNWLVSVIWRPIMLWKKRKLGKIGWWIIISDVMLKFHGDKRKDILLKYKSKHWEK